MRRLFPLFIALVAFVAVAGSRAKESDGTVPSASTDGVSIADSVGCRASVHVDGGNVNTGAKLIYHYYDAVTLWNESASTLACTVTARADAGTRVSYVCPDLEPLARFGRVGVSLYGMVGIDGGTPNGVGADGGQNLTPVARIECWGPSIP